MRNMYAIALGLIVAGASCLAAEHAGARSPSDPSFGLTAIGYLLASGGLMLLIACLAGSVEDWVRTRCRRVARSDKGDWERPPPPVAEPH